MIDLVEMSNPPELSINQVYVYVPPEKCYDNACDVPLKSAPPKILILRQGKLPISFQNERSSKFDVLGGH